MGTYPNYELPGTYSNYGARCITRRRMVGALVFGNPCLPEAFDVECDLARVLHIKEAPLGNFAGEVGIDLPKVRQGGFQFSGSLQVP